MCSNGGEDRPDPLPEQQAFIDRAGNSHGLLVAGPGTGKTFTLERLSEHIVETVGHRDSSIVLVTLTRSMAAKLESDIPYGDAQTLHSYALEQLNRLGEAGGRRIPDEWEKAELIRRDLRREVEAAFEDAPASLDDVDSFLNKLRSGLRTDQEGPEDLTPEEERVERAYSHQREFFRYRLLDEIALALVRLLEQGTELDEPPEFVLVDEYQDLTAGELRLLQLLAERFGTWILVCGDDRQSIYGFRDANREAIQRFSEIYGLDEINFLSKSRRLPELLCRFAERTAASLPSVPGVPRPELEPWPGRDDEGILRLFLAPSPEGEARWVRDECTRLVTEEGYDPWEIMIIISLFKEPVFARLQETEEEAQDLPFGFYRPGAGGIDIDPLEVRLLTAATHLLWDEDDQLSWRTLVELTEGLGDVRITRLLMADERSFYQSLATHANGSEVLSRPLEAGRNLLERYGPEDNVEAAELIHFLANELGLAVDTRRMDQLTDQLGESGTPREWNQRLIELQYTEETAPDERPNEIPVRTIFGAKGLDAPVVFLMNAQEECFTGRGDPDEGLRKLYVAITRASDRLYISAPSYLEHRSLGHAMGRRRGSLAPNLVRAAASVGVEVEQP